jgi:hypothetical protein
MLCQLKNKKILNIFQQQLPKVRISGDFGPRRQVPGYKGIKQIIGKSPPKPALKTVAPVKRASQRWKRSTLPITPSRSQMVCPPRHFPLSFGLFLLSPDFCILNSGPSHFSSLFVLAREGDGIYN